MKYAICFLASSVVLFGVTVPVAAQCGATTFNGGGTWDKDIAWSNGVPDATKVAIIPVGETCDFPANSSGYAGVACSVDVRGTLNLSNAISPGVNTLTISQDSEIDGTMVIDVRTKFYIAADVTVDGVGDINLSGGGDVFFTSGGSHTLTLENDCTSALDESCGVVLHGFGKISIPLTNNSLVIADTCGVTPLPSGFVGSLTVAGSPTNGTGIWRADKGDLGFATSVSGSGTWQLWSECEPGAVGLIIASACTGLTGPVEIGTPHLQEITADIRLDADFCTIGNLNWHPLSSSADVIVEANKRFRAGVASCSGF